MHSCIKALTYSNSVSTCPAAGQTHFFRLCCRAVPPDNYIINLSFRNQRARTLDFLFKSEPGGWLQACNAGILPPRFMWHRFRRILLKLIFTTNHHQLYVYCLLERERKKKDKVPRMSWRTFLVWHKQVIMYSLNKSNSPSVPNEIRYAAVHACYLHLDVSEKPGMSELPWTGVSFHYFISFGPFGS